MEIRPSVHAVTECACGLGVCMQSQSVHAVTECACDHRVCMRPPSVSLLTIVDTRHSKTLRGIGNLLIYYRQVASAAPESETLAGKLGLAWRRPCDADGNWRSSDGPEVRRPACLNALAPLATIPFALLEPHDLARVHATCRLCTQLCSHTALFANRRRLFSGRRPHPAAPARSPTASGCSSRSPFSRTSRPAPAAARPGGSIGPSPVVAPNRS